ncbi:hypothetical protein [Streptomyces iconiensis]|uniref:Uncharacterized protein n=1 Tax=Streptomyces iconiensis TaxID=1384038 RepID=A0ABT7A6B6_9ACTN|nr:hypothetical protein [Streptomyces iconiensis]MDJ1136859.1 hypothetical protein [Streptomyces iconiensis]
MSSIPPTVVTQAPPPRQPKVIVTALAAGYVAGYTAAFGVGEPRTAVAQGVVGAVAWLLWARR